MQQIKDTSDAAESRNAAAIEAIRRLHSEAKKALKTAVTGDAAKGDNEDAVYGTHADHYAHGGAGNQGKALASDIACLCAAATATNLCDHAGGITSYDNSGANNAAGAKTAFQALKGRCGKRENDGFVSPSKIDAALAGFTALFGTSAKTGNNPENIIGGSGGDDTCDGTDTAKACVNYNGVIENKDITTIPWVKQLFKAKQILLEAEKQRLQLSTNNALLHSLTTQTWAVYATLGIQKDRQTEASPSEQVKESITPACSERERPTCTDPCEWEEKDEKGECKPKPGTKNPVEGAGETPREGAAST
uniref:Variant surface glycoprotein 1125.2863 n=1 Tax=Trypanosoma brucei TaxID=5691 RepID=A0A1J0R8U5_9TRYP|nr:variant surface glycoprotein 1125.2863 [Trypanosoma brucei]